MDYRSLILKKMTLWITPWLTTWVSVTMGFIQHAQVKVDHIRSLDEKYSQLMVENAALKDEFEAFKFEEEAKFGALQTKVLAKRLSQETGVRTGRTIASVNYKIPTELSSPQLYTLGLSYFLSQEDEKAAVVLTSLMSLDKAYRTAKNFLMAGVIWYRLDNLAQADQSFDSVLKPPAVRADDQGALERYQAEARLWKALVAKRLQSEDQSQYWLKDLLDHHPHAVETSWINSTGESP